MKTQPLLERVSSIETLQAAATWLQSEYPQYEPDLGQLANKLKSGEYCFNPLTTVSTTNKLGEAETLEVWESQDRLVLKAMSLVLKDHLSDSFPTCCHHLEGRGGIKKAVRKTRDFVRDNPDSWVMKTDVKGYYAHIDHFILYNQMQALMPNENYLLRLTWQYLKRTVYDGGNYYERELGISLGCPLSPLMAAVYLQPLDEAFEGREWFYARFMDDWIIITPTRWKLNVAVKKVNLILNQHKLTKAYDKTFIGRSQRGVDFLGYHLTPESLTMGKVSLQRRDARIHRLYEQGADKHRVGEYVSRWQRWAKAGLEGRLTENEEFHNFPRQIDSTKLPLEAKFLALGVASVLSTAAFDSHATIYRLGTDASPNELQNCTPDSYQLISKSWHFKSYSAIRTPYGLCMIPPAARIGFKLVFQTTAERTVRKKYNFFTTVNAATCNAEYPTAQALDALAENHSSPFELILKHYTYSASTPPTFWARLSSASAPEAWGDTPPVTFTYGVADTRGEVTLSSTLGLLPTTCPSAPNNTLNISTPANATLTASSDTFSWANTGATNYWLQLGTDEGRNDLFDSGLIPPDETSRDVNNLPTDGSTVHVRIWQKQDAKWESVDKPFTAANIDGGGSSTPPTITPANEATLTN